MPVPSVVTIANAILEKTGEISAMKLHKLCYYAQAWHLVWHDKPIFKEAIEAWRYGPVTPHLYSKHKDSFSIKKNFFKGQKLEQLSQIQLETIDKVVDYYNKYDAQQLSDLTHQEEPWKRARSGLSESDRSNNVIRLEDIQNYYASL